MKNSIRFMSFIGLLALSRIAYSGPINDTYTSGDTLTPTTLNNIKSAVNDNDSRVTTNATGTAANAAGVSTNAAGITTNTADIASNAADISTNATGIGVNTDAITANATGIGANTADISTNATGIDVNTDAITANATGIGANTAGVTTNAAGIGSNAAAITANAADITSLNTRMSQVETSQLSVVDIDCTGDSAAFSNTLITDNTNYVLNGVCDGPIEIRGRRNVAILGAGVEPIDGIAGSGALFISTSMDILLNDLVLTALDFSNVLIVERNSFVEIENTNISGGDTGININTNATVQIQSGVSVEDFRNNGANVGNGGVLIVFQPTSFIGSGTSINDLTFGLSTFGGGTIFITDLASGTVITPTESQGGILSTRAVSAGDNGTIIVEGAATINGSVFTGGSANLRISGAVDINGHVWASGGSLMIRSASTITGNVSAYDGGHISINNSTINSGTDGCCFFVQDNSTVTLDNTTYTVENPEIGSGGRLNLWNGSSLSFPNKLVITRGAGVVLGGDSNITGTGIEISRYGTLTLDPYAANINLNGTNITCTDAEGYDNGGVIPLNPGAVNCP